MQKVKPGYKLVKSLFGKYEEIPEEWEQKKIGEFFELKQGIYSEIILDVGKYPIYGANGVIGFSNSFMHKDRTVLVSCRGEKCGVIHLTTKNSWVNNNSIALIPKDQKNTSALFFFQFLKNSNFIPEITGSAQPQIIVSILAKKKILSPSFAEQQKIASILSNVDDLILCYGGLIKKNTTVKNKILNDIIIHGFGHHDFKHISLGRSFLLEKIPKSWNVKRLRDVATVKGRIGWKNLRSDEYTDSGPLMLSVWSMPDETPFGIDYTKGFERLTEFRYEESPEIQLQNEDILLSKDGANIGKVGIVKKLSEPTTVNSHIAVIRPKKDLILGNYLYWYLKSTYFQKYCQSSITGTGTPGFSQDSIRKSIIPLPEFHEQKKISGLLFNLEQQISEFAYQKYRQKILKKGLMQKLLTGQIRVKV